MLGAVELWVRWQWDVTRGVPGFFLSDPLLGQRLSPGYRGWFAGVPVRINSLGFRDTREYTLAKPPGTFRILVFGDSVTFGHGAIDETTYPFLLEQRLKTWRPDVAWEVWNLGVPGYNTANELAYLLELGPRANPDLVIVGFYENDLSDNEPPTRPSWLKRVRSSVQRTLQRYFYSYELYKRISLTLLWRLGGDSLDSKRLEHVQTEEALLHQGMTANAEAQQITAVDYFDDQAVRAFDCVGVGESNRQTLADWQALPGWGPWLAAVRELQRLNREGAYRVVFFVNLAPPVCPGEDRFYTGQGIMEFDADLVRVLGEGTPVASTLGAFLHHRPSQMPLAAGHSIGNANRVKADVLFELLRETVLSTTVLRQAVKGTG